VLLGGRTRQDRRLVGKSDSIDAISAAQAALGETTSGAAKTRDGNVEAIRVLRVVKISARKARAQAVNQIHSLVCTAPDERCVTCPPGSGSSPARTFVRATAGMSPR
jgi:hypothetical protein